MESAKPLPAGAARLYGGDVLACGFGITVATWIVAYISRLPMVNAAGHVTVGLMLAVILVGGMLTARYSPRGLMAAILAGAVSGLLNNLIVGSLVSDAAAKAAATMAGASGPAAIPVPSMALWFGGSILTSTVLAGVGGIGGRFFPSRERHEIRWTQVFAVVLAAATLPLLTIGGLVTAFHAGLAVPDWPQSYGYNMFLFPLSKMQSNQGNFYEHAHRLMGSLVGFTALALAIYSTIAEKRRWIKTLAWSIGFAILVQAVLGGTRVTDRSVDLAIAHGIFAQVVFAAMACLAAVTGRSFLALRPVASPSASTDRSLTIALFFALIIQLILGAFVRHKGEGIMLHITMAALVSFLVLACGIRAWGVHGAYRPLRDTGRWIMGIVTLQVVLGVIALVFRSASGGPATTEGAMLTTAHQANGALLLAVSAVLATWTWRLVIPPAHESDVAEKVPAPATSAA